MATEINTYDKQAAGLLETAIHALDGLNSWVRSPGYREGYWLSGGPVFAVYFYKGLALEKAHAFMPMSMRRVKANVKCRDCGGDGRYMDSNGFTHRHCWACNSTGRATLYFVETEFPFGVRWHTPRERFPYHIKDSEWRYDSDAYEETDWRPNTPGKDMALVEAVRLLNIVESYFTERPKPYHHEWGTRDAAKYTLYIGHTDCRKCAFCESTPHNSHWCVRRGRLTWRDHCCDVCEKRIKDSGEFSSVFDAFPLPEYFLDHEEIRKWMRRNFIDVGELRPQKAAAKVPF